MPWKPIIVGVDGTLESVRAAQWGAYIADLAGTTCRLVHAARDYWSAVTIPDSIQDYDQLDQAALSYARSTVTGSLRSDVPPAVLETLEVRVGRPTMILADAARRDQAGLVVLGGKHRRGLERIGGSTITHMVRAHDLPVLATDGGGPSVARVLAAVDLSYAAKPVIDAAERWAGLFQAQLRVMHVVEPTPLIPGVAVAVNDDETFAASERLFELSVLPLIARPGVETVVRRGRSAAAIVDEATHWHADLIVVGSHGRGWVDRLLIGSTSERLLHVLPASTLVVPVAKPTGRRALEDAAYPWEARLAGAAREA